MTIAYTQGPWETTHHGEWVIGRDPICGEVVVAKTVFNWKEDARLISAAPDLLEALRGFITGAEAMGWNTDKARAAIAKATGEEE